MAKIRDGIIDGTSSQNRGTSSSIINHMITRTAVTAVCRLTTKEDDQYNGRRLGLGDVSDCNYIATAFWQATNHKHHSNNNNESTIQAFTINRLLLRRLSSKSERNWCESGAFK
jgi:hypothetical protein